MLNGKIAVVTGAGSGLGRCIAKRFAEAGAVIVALDRDRSSAEAAVAECSGGAEHLALEVDVASSEDVQRAFASLERVDLLVNSAGIGETTREPLELPSAEWERLIAVNLSGTFYCAQAAAKRMVERRSGSIVNISSVTGLRGFAKRPAYSASKAGILGLTRSLSQDLAPLGVRINSICPGLIETPMTASYMRDGGFVARLGHSIPMARSGEPDDIARAAMYLADDELSGFVTGVELTVDGGFVAAGTFDPTNRGTAATTSTEF